MGFMDRNYKRGKSFSFGKVGDKVVGQIVDIDEDATTLPNDRGQTFDATVLTLTIDGNRSTSHDDREKNPIDLTDGDELTVWLPVNRRALCQAVKAAVLDAGARAIEVGATIGIQYTANGEQKDRSKRAPKLFAAQYSPPVRSVAADSII